MKVAIPVVRLEHTGGIQRYTWHVADELARRGHDVTIYAPSEFDGVEPAGVAFQAVGAGHQPVSRRGGIDMMSFPLLASASIMRHQPGAARYGPTGSMILPGVYTVHSAHAAWVADRRAHLDGAGPSLFDRGLNLFERAALRMPRTRVTVVSPRVAENLAAAYGVDAERFPVTPPAVDPEEFRPPTPFERDEARARSGLDPWSYAVGIVANYNFENKGVGRLITACAKVGAVLMVAGIDRFRQQRFATMAREGGGDVRFLGLVEDMNAFYGSLDVLAFPSDSEGYPSSAHEGMAAGVATVLSRQCGITGLLRAGAEAVVVDRRDPDALWAALDELRHVERRREIANAGTRWARARTWTVLGDAIEAELCFLSAS